METKDLLTLESKIYQEYEKDGAVEFLMGMGLFFASGVLESRGSPAFAGLIPIFIIMFKKAWKKYITYPRLGYARFSESRMLRRKREKHTILLVAAACVAFIFLSALAASGTFSSEVQGAFKPYARMVMGGIIALIIIAVAAVRRITHLYYVGAFALACFVLGHFLGFSPGIALLLTSFVLLIIGIIRLIRFVRANPKLEDGGVHDVNA
ncbi:hypothetical protein EHM69_02440 [candidate division KSB1 bacterium]|nr:MAG: hypothetical protein EHM69_02440 [candidate division KSB1 bacterium]